MAYSGPSYKDVQAAKRVEAHDLITRIADRATRLLGADNLSTQMDVLCVHTNDTPLRLGDLLTADDFNFSHDICGIARHLDRANGKLCDFFVPRFADRKPLAA